MPGEVRAAPDTLMCVSEDLRWEEEESLSFFSFFLMLSPDTWVQVGSEIEGGGVVLSTSVHP